jgi:hypothetical protein
MPGRHSRDGAKRCIIVEFGETMRVRQKYKPKRQGRDRDQQCGPRDQCGRRRSPDVLQAARRQRPNSHQHIKASVEHAKSYRTFKRQFNLADYVQVKGAAFDNGLLQIELVREIPEAMKPRRIAINGSPASKVQQIETKAA